MSKLVLLRHLRTLFALLAWCLLGAVAPASAQRIPSQYIAKLYTEVLGRVPDAEAHVAVLRSSCPLRDFGGVAAMQAVDSAHPLRRRMPQ